MRRGQVQERVSRLPSPWPCHTQQVAPWLGQGASRRHQLTWLWLGHTHRRLELPAAGRTSQMLWPPLLVAALSHKASEVVQRHAAAMVPPGPSSKLHVSMPTPVQYSARLPGPFLPTDGSDYRSAPILNTTSIGVAARGSGGTVGTSGSTGPAGVLASTSTPSGGAGSGSSGTGPAPAPHVPGLALGAVPAAAPAGGSPRGSMPPPRTPSSHWRGVGISTGPLILSRQGSDVAAGLPPLALGQSPAGHAGVATAPGSLPGELSPVLTGGPDGQASSGAGSRGVGSSSNSSGGAGQHGAVRERDGLAALSNASGLVLVSACSVCHVCATACIAAAHASPRQIWPTRRLPAAPVAALDRGQLGGRLSGRRGRCAAQPIHAQRRDVALSQPGRRAGAADHGRQCLRAAGGVGEQPRVQRALHG
jgi:hypothetical protein